MAFPIGMALGAAGGLASLFGGSGDQAPVMSPQQEWAAKFLKRYAKRLMQQSQSVPGSLPQEQAALAQQKGLAGEAYGASQSNLLALLGSNGNLSESSGDALGQFEQGRIGNLMNIDAASLMQSLQRREGFAQQAAGAAGQVASIAGNPAGGVPGSGGMDLSGLFSSLGQQIGYGQQNRPQAPANAPSALRPPMTSVVQNSVFSGSGNGNYDPRRYREPFGGQNIWDY